ncbi:hypothetical protein [Streptomyces sp. NBC_00366]|uniref:hypothetical protein n=1 Tax=Streptomyces sp. NBC_00366 TaxID=2975727 RepID=UPI002E2615FA
MTHVTGGGDERDHQVGRDLTVVAQLSTAIFVVGVGVGGMLVLSRDRLLVAVGNQPWLFSWAAFFAVFAIGLNLASFLFQGDVSKKRGNRRQEGFLLGGALFFLVAVALTIVGIACATVGDGRPSLTEVSVKPNSMVEVAFTVHASGVKKKSTIIVDVQPFSDKKAEGSDPLYRALLRPDDTGEINQRVAFTYKRANNVNRLTIRVRPDHEGVDGADCDASQATDKLGCATVLLP